MISTRTPYIISRSISRTGVGAGHIIPAQDNGNMPVGKCSMADQVPGSRLGPHLVSVRLKPEFR